MKLIHQVIKIRSIRTSPSLINKLNNMEDDFMDDYMWDWTENNARIYKHMEDLEKECEELPSDFNK